MGITKQTIKDIHSHQQMISEASDAAGMLRDLQEEIREEYDGKGEKAQEAMDKKYPWLQDFLDVDMQSFCDDIDTVTGIQLGD